MMEVGSVYLVGAGPGSQDLLTLRALRLIETADVVVYDRLVSEEILELIPHGAARVHVGKRAGSHPVPQSSINEILIKLAKDGHTVVRLKGGDPMIFGRGGEEAQALSEQGIAVQTVPGITAAQGCAASLNMPLTQRGIADSLLYMTGHTMAGQLPAIDWAGITGGNTTLVIYMGSTNIASITSRLNEEGLPGSTPAMAVSNGTRVNMRKVITTLNELATDVASADLKGPVLFFIGKAVNQVSSNELMDYGNFKEKAVAYGL